MPVVDASVVVDWVAPDVDPEGPAGRLLTDLAGRGEALYGPSLLGQEVANALLTGIRRGRWDGAAADASFSALQSLPVTVVESEGLLPRAWDLARRYDEHPLYDMVYLALAQMLSETLYTADRAHVARIGQSNRVVLVG
jgi:predicted nucleic acid-binding protein